MLNPLLWFRCLWRGYHRYRVADLVLLLPRYINDYKDNLGVGTCRDCGARRWHNSEEWKRLKEVMRSETGTTR